MTNGDRFLIIIVIIISIVSLFLINRSLLKVDDKILSIELNGEKYEEIILDGSHKNKQIYVESDFGYNIVEINGYNVKVIDASCPDKLDVKQGEISRVGEMIICLPNRLVLEIKGMKSETGIDKLSR